MRLLHLEEHVHLPVCVFRCAHLGCPASLPNKNCVTEHSRLKALLVSSCQKNLQQARLTRDATGFGTLMRIQFVMVLEDRLEDRFILQKVGRSVRSPNASSPQEDVEKRAYLLSFIPFCRCSPHHQCKQLLC